MPEELPAKGTVGLDEDEPNFEWRHVHRLDAQGRVQFPASWRPAMSGDTKFTLVIWQHQTTKRKYIMGLTQKPYQRLASQLEAMGLGDPRASALRRRVLGNALTLSLDPAGRVCLPPDMVKDASLLKDVQFVGGGKGHFQVWDPETFKQCCDAEEAVADEAYTLI